MPAICSVLAEDIAVLGRRIGGLDPHEHHVCPATLHHFIHLQESLEIRQIHVRIYRQYNDSLFRIHLSLGSQVGGCQYNGRERVTAFRFHHYIHFFAQLPADGILLGSTGCHHDVILNACGTNLPVHTLYHGFMLSGLIGKEL